MWSPFCPFWSVKYLNFWPKLPIRIAHHTFLESRHPGFTKNLYYIQRWHQIQIRIDKTQNTSRKCRLTQIRIEQNNDHALRIYKTQFRNSFN